MKRVVYLLIAIVSLSCLHEDEEVEVEQVDDKIPQSANTQFYVSEIVDGDTFYVLDSTRNNSKLKIRLIGIDAPESRKVFNKEKHPFGDSAKNFLKNLIYLKNVILEYDIDSTDRYGRKLCYASVQDTKEVLFVNSEMLRNGYAWILTVPPNVKYVDLFVELQKEARENLRGIWKYQWNLGDE